MKVVHSLTLKHWSLLSQRDGTLSRVLRSDNQQSVYSARASEAKFDGGGNGRLKDADDDDGDDDESLSH